MVKISLILCLATLMTSWRVSQSIDCNVCSDVYNCKYQRFTVQSGCFKCLSKSTSSKQENMYKFEFNADGTKKDSKSFLLAQRCVKAGEEDLCEAKEAETSHPGIKATINCCGENLCNPAVGENIEIGANQEDEKSCFICHGKDCESGKVLSAGPCQSCQANVRTDPKSSTPQIYARMCSSRKECNNVERNYGKTKYIFKCCTSTYCDPFSGQYPVNNPIIDPLKENGEQRSITCPVCQGESECMTKNELKTESGCHTCEAVKESRYYKQIYNIVARNCIKAPEKKCVKNQEHIFTNMIEKNCCTESNCDPFPGLVEKEFEKDKHRITCPVCNRDECKKPRNEFRLENDCFACVASLRNGVLSRAYCHGNYDYKCKNYTRKFGKTTFQSKCSYESAVPKYECKVCDSPESCSDGVSTSSNCVACAAVKSQKPGTTFELISSRICLKNNQNECNGNGDTKCCKQNRCDPFPEITEQAENVEKKKSIQCRVCSDMTKCASKVYQTISGCYGCRKEVLVVGGNEIEHSRSCNIDPTDECSSETIEHSGITTKKSCCFDNLC